MKRTAALLAALLSTACPFAARADLLIPQLPELFAPELLSVTTVDALDRVTFIVRNPTTYNLSVDFTLAVVQSEDPARRGPARLGSGGPFPNAKQLVAGGFAEYSYSHNPADSVSFWLEASDIPGDRDYQDVLRGDRDQWAAVIDGATQDPTTWLEMANILTDRPGGNLPMTELYPASLNPPYIIMGAFADPPGATAVPEPARMWLAWPIVLLGLFGFRRQWMRSTLSAVSPRHEEEWRRFV